MAADIVALRRELVWLFAPLVGSAAIEAAIRAEAYILGKGEQSDEDDAASADSGRNGPDAEGDQPVEGGDPCWGHSAGSDPVAHPAEPGGEAAASGAEAARKGRLTSPGAEARAYAYVVDLVAAGAKVTGIALANALGCGLATARKQLAGLEAAGRVRRIGIGAGTRYELVDGGDAAASDPVEKINTAPPSPPSIPRAAPEALPAGHAPLPEDVLRDRRRDPEPAPTDIDTVVDWLAANGDRLEVTGESYRLNGTTGWTARDLIKRANGKRAELGLPAFSIGRG